MLSQHHGVQLGRKPCFRDDFDRAFIADLAGGNRYRLAPALSGDAFNRLRAQIFMLYLLSALFLLLRMFLHALRRKENFILHSPLARAAQVNDLWPLFPGAVAAYDLGGLAAAGT